jgi:hypothetical protein
MRAPGGQNFTLAGLKGEMTSREEGTMSSGTRTTRRLRGLLLTFALVALIVGAIALLAAPSAFADSTYKVVECNGGASHSAPDAKPSGDYNKGEGGGGVSTSSILYGNGCSGAGYVYLYPNHAHAGSRFARVKFQARPTTYFGDGSSFEYYIGAAWPNCTGGNACWYAAAYVGIASYGMFGTPHSGFATWSSCGAFCNNFRIEVSCPWSLCVHNDSPPWYYDYIEIRNIAVNVIDTEGPTLNLRGSLLADPIAHGTSNLQIDAADQGGGVEAVTVDVNGTRVAVPATVCPGMTADRSVAIRFRACDDFHSAAGLDTTKTPWRDGANILRVCVSDVATGPGVANTVCEQRTISVDNSCPDSSGASGEARAISAGLENPKSGQLQRTRSVRSSEGTALRGRLTGSGGTAVKAASVCVYETVDEPAGIEQLVQVAKSSSTGSYGVEIPGGPTRIFRVAYRYAGHQIESPSVYLDSSVLPTLTLTKSKLSNGRSVGFRGRIPGPGAQGRGVTMQAKVGKKWRSFKQLQTDSTGRFKGKYRFTQTRGLVRYVFRALVKKQGGYPYSAGSSPKRKVLVRG